MTDQEYIQRLENRIMDKMPKPKPKNFNMEDYEFSICKAFNLYENYSGKATHILSLKTRKREVVYARFCAMTIRLMMGETQMQIGKTYGHDHVTVLHAKKQIFNSVFDEKHVLFKEIRAVFNVFLRKDFDVKFDSEKQKTIFLQNLQLMKNYNKEKFKHEKFI